MTILRINSPKDFFYVAESLSSLIQHKTMKPLIKPNAFLILAEAII